MPARFAWDHDIKNGRDKRDERAILARLAFFLDIRLPLL
jgi:hypothetical protein